MNDVGAGWRAGNDSWSGSRHVQEGLMTIPTLKRMSALAIATAALGLGSVTVARAQEEVVAKVPFDFIVNGKQMPAGDYQVSQIFEGSGVLTVANADGLESVNTFTVASSADLPA